MEKDYSGAVSVVMALLVVSVLGVMSFSIPGRLFAADSNDGNSSEHVSNNEDNGIERSQAADL